LSQKIVAKSAVKKDVGLSGSKTELRGKEAWLLLSLKSQKDDGVNSKEPQQRQLQTSI
jgi:hypothetical protein